MDGRIWYQDYYIVTTPSLSQQLLQGVALPNSGSGNALAVEKRAPTSRLTINRQPTFTPILSAQGLIGFSQ
jgi:hypothetical protein